MSMQIDFAAVNHRSEFLDESRRASRARESNRSPQTANPIGWGASSLDSRRIRGEFLEDALSASPQPIEINIRPICKHYFIRTYSGFALSKMAAAGLLNAVAVCAFNSTIHN